MAITIDRLECWVHRAPIQVPVVNSFRAMTNRPALWLRLTASDGVQGWGEVFCNFPQVGAEHRARLLESIFVPLVIGQPADSPSAITAFLEQKTHRLALQCGEPGPFAQISGALDQAMWDLCAKRMGHAVWMLKGGQPRVKVYASGIGPDNVVRITREKWQEGYRAFKLKVGFGSDKDLSNLAGMREVVGPKIPIMCDANQAWDLAQAKANIALLSEFSPFWLEEPLPADSPHQEWLDLSRSTDVALAAGENLRGDQFRQALEHEYLKFIQPDVGKWGGLSGGWQVAKAALQKGTHYCPHWLAGGVGLAASMHALAGSGDIEGWAEVDANPNPLREQVWCPRPVEGVVTLGEEPGFGVEPPLDELENLRVQFRA